MSDKIITAIDLGSSKICTVIAALHNNGKLEIKGVGISISVGIENGIVKDITKTSDSIKASITQAEKQAHTQIDNIFVAISGLHIKSRFASGKISIANGNDPSDIDDNHIAAVINDAKNSMKSKAGSVGFEILHCLPHQYDVDDQKGIFNPIGMSGFSLQVKTLLLYGEDSHLRNIRKSFSKIGVEVFNFVVGTVATSESVINEDERRLGCLVLDIGGGTSDMLVYKDDCIHTYICNPQGGKLISNDLEVGLRTPPASAENLKLEYGNAVASSIKQDNLVEVQGIGGRESQKKSLTLLAQITQMRAKDILDNNYKNIFAEYKVLENLTAGIILTGGTAQIKNINYLVEDESVFNLPCKIAFPDLKRITGSVSNLDNPAFTCVVGLLYYIVKNETIEETTNFDLKDLTGNFKKTFQDIMKKISEL